MQQLFEHSHLVLRYEQVRTAPSRGSRDDASKLYVYATTLAFIDREHSVVLLEHGSRLRDPEPGVDQAWTDQVDECLPANKRTLVDLVAATVNLKDDLQIFRLLDRGHVGFWNIAVLEHVVDAVEREFPADGPSRPFGLRRLS